MKKLEVATYSMIHKAKIRFQNFLNEEKGGSEIIAMVLVIAIVLVLAAIFWDNISVFFNDLWDSVVGKNPIDDISK